MSSYEAFVADLGDWQIPLADYLKKPNFRKLYEYVNSEYESAGTAIYPPRQLIFNAFKKTPFATLKAVVVGQDPYIKEGEAMGLCFSIPRSVKTPPSLKNIYKVNIQF